jgi:hypothetical protein
MLLWHSDSIFPSMLTMQRWYSLLGDCMSAELGTTAIDVEGGGCAMEQTNSGRRDCITAELELRDNVELLRLNSVKLLGVLHSLKE